MVKTKEAQKVEFANELDIRGEKNTVFLLFLFLDLMGFLNIKIIFDFDGIY